MLNTEYNKLSILAKDSAERRALFNRSCELLSLDKEKEAQKQKIERKKNGFDVSINNLIVHCFLHNLHGGFDFREEDKIFFIKVPSVPSVGAVAINAPETIKPTSVDEVVAEQAVEPKLPGATFDSAFESVGDTPAYEAPSEVVDQEPEDDDSPF